MLISLSGLPGTGKSTVACAAARQLGAVWLRIDSIEQPMRRAGLMVEGVGYEVAQAVARDNLSTGRTVIADCVNPWPLTRDAWRQIGAGLHVGVLEIEFICTDIPEHRRRLEARRLSDPGWPSWQDVLNRDYRPWDRDRIVIDTATNSIDEAAAMVVGAARSGD
jgi:predicted kinase